MPSLEFRENLSGNWLVVSSRLWGRCYGPGVWLFHPCFQFLSGQLEAFYYSDLPLSLTVPSYSFIRVLPFPSLSLLSLPSYSHYHPCLSHSCPHLVSPSLQIHHLSVVMSSFLLSGLQRSTPHSYILLFELVRCLLYHPLSNLIHVNVIPIHSPRCACVCLCFIRSPPLSQFDRHSPLISITHPVRVLFIRLVSIIVVFHTAHAHVSFFVTEPRTANLHFAAYSPLRLLRSTGGVRIPRLSFSLAHPPRNLQHPYIQPTSRTVIFS